MCRRRSSALVVPVQRQRRGLHSEPCAAAPCPPVAASINDSINHVLLYCRDQALVRFITKSNGRPSGQAKVQMQSKADAELAQNEESGRPAGQPIMYLASPIHFGGIMLALVHSVWYFCYYVSYFPYYRVYFPYYPFKGEWSHHDTACHV